MEQVDLVVPYVDASDSTWQSLFNKYTPHKNEESIDALNRFRGQGDFFKYFFRCIEKNLPFINSIFLIVQSKSQVPEWLNQEKIKIILHEDFIPKEYLPTFNSTAIEMFVPFIPGLSEHFIYANDDMFIVKKTNKIKFFLNNKTVTKMRDCYMNCGLYGNHVKNSYQLIYNDKTETNCYPAFHHVMRPLLKSKCLECFELNKKAILDSISIFRDSKNVNIYIYDHYMLYSNNGIDLSELTCGTINTGAPANYIIKILNNKYSVLNICDSSDSSDIYSDKILNMWFNLNYPNKSKYEL